MTTKKTTGLTITTTHIINIDALSLYRAFRNLVKERYPMFNETDISNVNKILQEVLNIGLELEECEDILCKNK